ncbi:retroviral-like aspartic protease family protein [Roseiterribacter gracilis]|uniref:Peptidase A2 domain-containing protein n=1 Tax=Roseiterribacter gracilis TaxID=2812848 RepID=A0A8S8XGH5_9PROT|nr:hypothetical protein TMPK1_33180 [Rhodospirillales bacterium TMPK1]
MTARAGTLVAALVLLSASPTRAAEPCKIPLVAEAKIEHKGSIYVQASIRGESVPMVVHTSSAVTSISKTTAQKFGLELSRETRYSLHGTHGELEAYNVTVPDFVIGNGRFPELRAMVIEGRDSGAAGSSVGAIGTDLLGAFDLEFDVQGGRFVLHEKTRCAHAPPWPADFITVQLLPLLSGRVQFSVKIDGRTLNAELDSGANRSFLTSVGARKLGITRDSPGIERASGRADADGQPQESYAYRFQSFELESETVRYPRLFIRDVLTKLYPQTYQGGQVKARSEEPPDLYLGADWLRAHRVYIGRATDEMHFTYLSGPIFEK